MSNNFLVPVLQVADSNGAPISGAKIYTYSAGTTTEAPTYSDSALSVANTNPIVADAAGRINAIYLKEQSYKFVIKDADDVEIETYDNYRVYEPGIIELQNALIGGGLAYSTKADLDADLAHSANQGATVYNDSTSSNNGIYKKVGASGAGSWTKISDFTLSGVTATVTAGQASVELLAPQVATNAASAQTSATAAEATKNDIITLANSLLSDEIVNTYAEAVAFTPKTAGMSFLILTDEGTGGGDRRTLRVWDGSAFGSPSFIDKAASFSRVISNTDNVAYDVTPDTIADGDVAKWTLKWGRYPLSNGPVGNPNYVNAVYAQGFNIGVIGRPEYTQLAYLAEHYELKYYQGNVYASEQFLTFIRPNDLTEENIRVRNYFLPHTLTPGASIRSERVDRHVFYDFVTGHEIMNWQLDNGSLFMSGRNVGGTLGAGTSNVRIFFDVNNAPVAHQLNAAGNANLNLPYFDNDNRLGLSGSGFKLVGSAPSGGNYGTDFYVLQALSGASGGVLKRTYGPTVTGDYFLSHESLSVSGKLYDTIQNNSGSIIRQLIANNASGDARIDFLTVNSGQTLSFGVDTSDGGALHVGLGDFNPNDPAILTRTGDLTIQGFMKFKPTAFASLGSASAKGAGATYYCTNLSGGAALVTSDGTDWRTQSGVIAAAA